MQQASERMQKLQTMLEKTPNDVFLVYAIAMEHKKAEDWASAVDAFTKVIQADPGDCYAYHQRGLVYEAINDLESARRSYREGIDAATRKGDHHAREEIAAALMMIEG